MDKDANEYIVDIVNGIYELQKLGWKLFTDVDLVFGEDTSEKEIHTLIIESPQLIQNYIKVGTYEV